MNRIDVILTVEDSCTVQLYMIGQHIYDNTLARYRMHYLQITPPDCYKCFICGLCGDFKTAVTGGIWEQLQTCNGGFVSYRAGWNAAITEAYDINGWSWEQSYVSANCMMDIDETVIIKPYTPEIGNITNEYVDACSDTTLETAVITECQSARDAKITCCDTIGGTYCDALQDFCEVDVCVAVNGNLSEISQAVYKIFTEPIDLVCNLSNAAGIFNENKTIPSPNAATLNPTPLPTDSPSIHPTNVPSEAPSITYCESIQRYLGTSLIVECLGIVNMASGTLIDTIPLVDHFKIEFLLSITSLNVGFTNVLYVGSNTGHVSDRYPSIFIFNGGSGTSYFQVGITNNPSAPSEAFMRCQSQPFTLPATDLSVVIEIDQSTDNNKTFTISIDGNECTDSVSNTLSYQSGGIKNISIPSTDRILSGGMMQDLIFTLYNERTLPVQCVKGINYWIDGNQVYATGDPHYRMWNGDYHDFQGIGSIDIQYYLITRKSGSTTTDLPFNMLLKNYYWTHSNAPMRSVDYITFELFDENGDYYLIFLQYNILKYTSTAVLTSKSTLYDSTDSTLSTFTVGSTVNIGQLFAAQVTSKTNHAIYFTLTIGGDCSISLYMTNIGRPKPILNNRYLQNLYVNPPTCYKCHITGLFGDFMRGPVGNGRWREGRSAKMPICDGDYANIKSGWISSTVQDTAFSSNGLSWKKDASICDRDGSTINRRRSLIETSGIIGKSDDFVFVDPCPSDSNIATLTATQCENTRNQYSTLCSSITEICDSLQENCNYDACVAADGNITRIASEVDNIFGRTLGFLQTVPDIASFYNNTDIVPAPGAPTDTPTTTQEADDTKQISVSLLLLYILSIFLTIN